jgi:hypothetical protein
MFLREEGKGHATAPVRTRIGITYTRVTCQQAGFTENV